MRDPVGKLTAASRLIDAGIAMRSAGYDVLATWVVASSARNMLAELKRAQGTDHFEDVIRLGLYYAARDYLAGKLPPEAAHEPELMQTIEPIARAIQAGQITSPADLTVSGHADAARAYWRQANAAFNFLKHADRDPDELLDVSELDASMLLIESCAIYRQLGGRFSEPMREFASLMMRPELQ